MTKPQQTVDFNLVTIRRPRDNDDINLEKRHNSYLPVHIGDILKDGTYKILHRLGHGLHSNIWLAEALLSDPTPRYVALKIFTSRCTEAEINSDILTSFDSVRDNPEKYPSEVREGLDNVVRVLDRFTVPGPVKEHVCHVMELVGPSLYREVEYGKRLPRLSVLALASQIARALVSVHHLGIVHGDLQKHNIAIRFPFDTDETFNVKEVFGEKPEAIPADEYSSFVAEGIGPIDNGSVEFSDHDEDFSDDDEDDELLSGYGSGTEDELVHMPQYFVLSPDPSNILTAAHALPPSFQLIDFTCSFRASDCRNPDSNAIIGTPLDLAPPEAHLPTLLRPLFSPASDMWSFGTLLFNLLTDDLLISYYGIFYQRDPMRFFFDCIRTLGTTDPIPPAFHHALSTLFATIPASNSGKQDRYSQESLTRLPDFYETGVWPRECQEPSPFRGNLRDRLAELREMKGLGEGEGWMEGEVEVLCGVIEGCVRWDPEKRLTARQVVEMLERAGVRA